MSIARLWLDLLFTKYRVSYINRFQVVQPKVTDQQQQRHKNQSAHGGLHPGPDQMVKPPSYQYFAIFSVGRFTYDIRLRPPKNFILTFA